MMRASAACLCALVAVGCSGEDDAGSAAGKPLEPVTPCTATLDSLWATPVTAGDRGEVLGCSELSAFDASEVKSRVASVPSLEGTTGVRRFMLAYRTERDQGEDGVSTALVYLPEKPRSGALPAVVAAHGTTGLDDSCAITHTDDHEYLDSLALAWAASGLPVIATDYAGLGTAGVQGYGNFPDTGRSVLDSARALRHFAGEDRISEKALVLGHSQGGGAALAAAAYANETPDVKLAGIVAFAPAFAYLSYVEAIRLSNVSMNGLRAAAATLLYADIANITDDESQAGAAFHPSIRTYLKEKTGSVCYLELAPLLDAPAAGYVPPATMADFIDPDFKAGAIDCADNGKCSGLPGQWAERAEKNDPHVDPSIPILFVQGELDTTLKPAQASCFFSRLVKDGSQPVECVYPGEDHMSIVPNATGFAVDWAMAAFRGKALPACPVDGSLPNCSLF